MQNDASRRESSFILQPSSFCSLESATVRRLLGVVVIIAVAACGKRGDPKPPVPIIPQATSDLVVTQRANKVILSWSYPALTTTGRGLKDIQRITILRYVEQLPPAPGGRDPNSILPGDIDPTIPRAVAMFSKVPTIAQAQFVKLSTKVDSIEKANLASATAGSRLIYDDTPPIRSTDGNPVRLTYAVVTEGEIARSQPSNLATIVPLAVALPPGSVAASASAEGVTITWNPPPEAAGVPGAPEIRGYNIYRTSGHDALAELATPVNTAPVTETKFNDAPPYGDYEYRVTAVAAVGPPLLQSDPSAPATITFKDLVAPPPPKNLVALIETNAVRLVWDPVDAADLAGYRVYRAEGVGHDAPREIGVIEFVKTPMKETTYLQKPVSLGIAFRYAVTSVDKSGNESAKTWTDWLVVPKSP